MLGLVSAPALGRRWWAATGAGAYAGAGTRPRPRRSGSPASPARADASFCYSSLTGWEQAGRLDAMLQIMRRHLAQPGVRRLLRLHAAGRGGTGRDGGAGAVAVGHRRAGADRHRGRRHVHRPWPAGTRRPARGRHERQVAARSPSTARCTTTSWPARPDRPRADAEALRTSILARWCPHGWCFLAAMIVAYGFANLLQSVAARGHRAPHLRPGAAAAAGRAPDLPARAGLPGRSASSWPSWPGATCRCSWSRRPWRPGSG